MNDWFERWFGAEYLALYPHRDEEEARAVVALVCRTVAGKQIDRILDLACGSGRHARALTELGWTVGIDLSMTLLEVAQRQRPHDPYVRGDMRALPFADGTFALTVNLFTSFGYFDTDDQNEEVVAEISRVTRVGGTFVLDYLNAPQVRDTLVPEDETMVGEKRSPRMAVMLRSGLR
jgi:SAM-dependent methyltransferase